METIAGISYSKPAVTLLQETGIGTAEYAARTCYDSFGASEHAFLQDMDVLNDPPAVTADNINSLNNITHSDLLDKLAWTHFHHSILEHANLTFLIKGTSRGVLQEHARHRIQAVSVRSTRYTMSSVINAFVASVFNTPKVFNSTEWFITKMLELDILVTTDTEYNRIEYRTIFSKLLHQMNTIGTEEFKQLAIAKSSLPYIESLDRLALYEALQTGKAKRNVGDSFKHIVSDTWKVDLVVTMNLRALKNYLDLRSSNSAYFQIHWLADEIAKVTPRKYLDLILKEDKINKVLN
ncbi:MAG: FAD-dependent thymidylate synthase [Thermoprotei archaeon]|nr:MAG: FAD-dependent thymidylate synthase [Thermoprotei archaeon]